MKLKPLYEQIISEIGDNVIVPPGATYEVHEHTGKVQFTFMDDDYTTLIRFPIKSGNIAVLTLDFFTDSSEGEVALTNKHAALKAMSYIVGSLEEWLNRYKSKYLEDGEQLSIPYFKFNPKSESEETVDDESFNRRDKLYRAYISKFAAKHGVSVTFSNTGGVVAKFEPNLTF